MARSTLFAVGTYSDFKLTDENGSLAIGIHIFFRCLRFSFIILIGRVIDLVSVVNDANIYALLTAVD